MVFSQKLCKIKFTYHKWRKLIKNWVWLKLVYTRMCDDVIWLLRNFATSLLFSCFAAAKLVKYIFNMDIKQCFMDFLEFSFIAYDDVKTILHCKEQIYKEFSQFAKMRKFKQKEIKNYFYNELIPFCIDWEYQEKQEEIKDKLKNIQQDFE